MRTKILLMALGAVGLASATPAYAHGNSTGDAIIGIIGGLVISEIASSRQRDRDRDYDRYDREYDRSERRSRSRSFDYQTGNWSEGRYQPRGVYVPSPPPVPEGGNCWAVRTYNSHGATKVRQFCD